jgi:hypothetical protein
MNNQSNDCSMDASSSSHDHSMDASSSSHESVSPTGVKDQLVLDIADHEGFLAGSSGLAICRLNPRVTFEYDANNDDVYKEYIEPNICLTDEEMEQMWWSRQELYDIYRKVRTMTIHFRKHHPDYTSDFGRLFTACAQSSGGLREYGIADLPAQRAARGLERHIHEIIPKFRNQFMDCILDIQSNMSPDLDLEVQARLLCAKSCQLSKVSRNLARFLGHHDSVEVADLIREELGASSATL